MKIMRKFKKAFALLSVIVLIIGGSFSFAPTQVYAGDFLIGPATSGMLRMLQDIFYSISFGRAGMKTTSKADDIKDIVHDVEDSIINTAGSLLIFDPVTLTTLGGQFLSNNLLSRISYSLSEEAFNAYCEDRSIDPEEATEEDLGHYVEDSGAGTYDSDNHVINLSNMIINLFANWLFEHKDEFTSYTEPNFVDYPNFPSYAYIFNGEETFTSLTDVLAEIGLAHANTITQCFTYSQFVIPDNIRDKIDSFDAFDLSTTPFICSIDGSKVKIISVPDYSFILMNGNKPDDIIDTTSFLYSYLKNTRGVTNIYNREFNQSYTSIPYNSNWSGGSYVRLTNYPPGFAFYVNDGSGWVDLNASGHYDSDFSLYNTNYYINFNLLSHVFAVRHTGYSASFARQSVYTLTTDNPGQTWYPYLNNLFEYALFSSVSLLTNMYYAIQDNTGSGDTVVHYPEELMDDRANVPVDLTKTEEVNQTFENQDASTAVTYVYNNNFAELTENMSDLLYRTSTIYKILFSWNSGILAIPAILQSILTGVNNLAASIGQQIGQWVIDGETGENFLTHLIPIDNIAAGMTEIPGYFIDEDSGEPFLGQTATAVNTVIDNLGVEAGSESIAELLGRIADGVEDLADEEEDEAATDVPLTMTAAIDTAVTNNGGRSPNDISNIMMLPLMFIFILLMILFLLLKALAFVVMIFRTPASSSFLNSGMITGLNWLKTTYITSSGGSLDMTNGTASNTITGLFGHISLWGILIFCVDLIAIFAIVKVAKRWADRQHGD